MAININTALRDLPKGDLKLLVSPAIFRLRRDFGQKPTVIHLWHNAHPDYWIGCGNVMDDYIEVHPSWFLEPVCCRNCLKGVTTRRIKQ
jgi:hypothetical protein